jgi:hypothetical protein
MWVWTPTIGASAELTPTHSCDKHGSTSLVAAQGFIPASSCGDKPSSPTANVGAGMVIQLGPDGKPIQQVPAGLIKRAPTQGSSKGLTVRQSSSPAGGLELQVGSRFVNTSVATIRPDGKVDVKCVEGAAATPEGKE